MRPIACGLFTQQENKICHRVEGGAMFGIIDSIEKVELVVVLEDKLYGINTN
jgi:hypothetical protein